MLYPGATYERIRRARDTGSDLGSLILGFLPRTFHGGEAGQATIKSSFQVAMWSEAVPKSAARAPLTRVVIR